MRRAARSIRSSRWPKPATAAERLKGAYVGIEGDDRALVAAERLANTLRMIPVRIPAAAKPAYHAGAAFVANYTVALVGVAERLARGAGVPADIAARIYLPLLGGAVANLNALGPAASLTGAVRRGDEQTIQGPPQGAECRGPHALPDGQPGGDHAGSGGRSERECGGAGGGGAEGVGARSPEAVLY